MQKLSNYILEKLKINKDSNIDIDFGEPILIKFWFYYKVSLNFLEEQFKKATQIENINISFLSKTNSDGEKLLAQYINNYKDLVNFYSYLISQYSLYGLYKDDFKELINRVNQYMIENYDDIKEYIDNISENEIKEYLKRYS